MYLLIHIGINRVCKPKQRQWFQVLAPPYVCFMHLQEHGIFFSLAPNDKLAEKYKYCLQVMHTYINNKPNLKGWYENLKFMTCFCGLQAYLLLHQAPGCVSRHAFMQTTVCLGVNRQANCILNVYFTYTVLTSVTSVLLSFFFFLVTHYHSKKASFSALQACASSDYILM